MNQKHVEYNIGNKRKEDVHAEHRNHNRAQYPAEEKNWAIGNARCYPLHKSGGYLQCAEYKACNAVISVLQIARVAKSNSIYFHCVDAIAKKYRSTIITTYTIFSTIKSPDAGFNYYFYTLII